MASTLLPRDARRLLGWWSFAFGSKGKVERLGASKEAPIEHNVVGCDGGGLWSCSGQSREYGPLVSFSRLSLCSQWQRERSSLLSQTGG